MTIISDTNTLNNEELLYYIKTSKNIEILKNNNSDTKDQLEFVKENGLLLQYMKDPSEAVKLAAVRQNGSAIQYIAHPSDELIIESIYHDNYYGLKYLENLEEIQNSTAIQIAIIKDNPRNISLIKDPSEELQLMAVTLNEHAIENIKRPTEAVQILAIEKNKINIVSIKHPSKAASMAAIKQSLLILSIIDKVDADIQNICMKRISEIYNVVILGKNSDTLEYRSEELSYNFLARFDFSIIKETLKKHIVEILIEEKNIDTLEYLFITNRIDFYKLDTDIQLAIELL